MAHCNQLPLLFGFHERDQVTKQVTPTIHKKN